jgi:ribosome modulation factor
MSEENPTHGDLRRAFREGQEAAGKPHASGECPYVRGTLRRQWLRGFHSGASAHYEEGLDDG